MNRLASLILVPLIAFGVAVLAQEPSPLQTTGDPYMGDWQGTWGDRDVCMQIIALGGGAYQANVLAKFDTRDAPVAVLQGRTGKGPVQFDGESDGITWRGTMNAEFFKGATSGGEVAEFSLEPVNRLSPTLGAKAPEGAVVLLDGTSLDGWVHPVADPRILNLTEVMGGEHRVAYVRTQVWSPVKQRLRLELGSDDGIKAWLNGELVHANYVERGPAPAQDVVEVSLNEGWNPLLLKITQSGGGAGVCAQFRKLDGSKQTGLYSRRHENLIDGDATITGFPLDDQDGAILDWQVSQSYSRVGLKASRLFDTVFPPEGDGAGVVWTWVLHERDDPQKCRWKLLDNGVMEVTTGGIVSTHKFTDHKLHVEFRTPFMPDARGQARGNSGVYLQGLYEVQVLDSYGLKGETNECGGIYQVAVPRVNMAAPPLQWQTYDIEFRAPRFDEAGRKIEDAIITVLHNGVLIHKNQRVPGPTAANIGGDIRGPRGLHLQDHSNPVQFRNIWAVELD